MDIDISGGALEALEELSRRSGRPITEELRFAISDRKFFSGKVEEGYAIKLIDPQDPHQVTVVNYS